MIAPALLSRLRKVDPETWQRFYDETIANIWYCNGIDKEGDDIEVYGCSLTEEATEAWLQHVIQDAIASRRLQFSVRNAVIGIDLAKARIWSEHNINGPHAHAEGNSTAEALLKAYIEAIT